LICAMAIFICRLAKFIGEPNGEKDRIAARSADECAVLSLDPPFAGVTFSACQGATAKKKQ